MLVEKTNYSVSRMARLLEVSRSGFHQRHTRSRSPIDALCSEVRVVAVVTPASYRWNPPSVLST